MRGGSFRMETELRFASSPRRLSLRLRVRTAGFFLPSASFRPLSAALSRRVRLCMRSRRWWRESLSGLAAEVSSS